MAVRIPTLVLTAALAFAAGGAPYPFNRSSADSATAPLTGEWNGNDNGYYYLHQIGDTLYGYGESNTQVEIPMYAEPDITEPAWATVLVGKITGRCVYGTWARVPRGRDAGKHGRLTLVLYAGGNMLHVVREFGGFGPTRLIRIAYIDRGNWATRTLPAPPAHACADPSAAGAGGAPDVGSPGSPWRIRKEE